MHCITLLLAVATTTVFGNVIVPPSTWNYPYPWPVQYQNLTSQRLNLSMAYMDVSPNTTSYYTNKTIVLLHGKNFCGATWEDTARRLSTNGYRVIIPDQIGFCKSSKPPSYQFSLQQLAYNTYSLLQSLGIRQAHVLGHSMGGMLATRFALMYPNVTSHLILTNPLGLEDWKALGVPWRPIDLLYKDELATNYTSIRKYQQATYYVNTWKSEYDVWVNMSVSLYRLPGENTTFAWNMALMTDAILTQPIVYELELVKAKTLLLIGMKDSTAIGKAWSPPAVQAKLGKYDVLGKEAAKRIPDAELAEFDDLGHSPQVQNSERYHQALFEWLGRSS
ncbi:alpha/beta hydrolase fold domain-containing protein [Cucurbitaria berberidis CBS 394.84]|uniref:Alpha/beta hydrolase fold domain-containing protein n=1 Tax=Cucurbitaria berberidis CBS 394.84 TaxID=1168544 RepID=A0A9P4GGW5_9PLEO|nr:alpha/beta hydrolase fold domain-containing protein [Cucurbitaria berberidis CBS 394.84]KAF1845340.1 alpha/beta hydrolase fold domain-containing protein [Cucurbitaria berberidis CBS 394.84]